MVPHLIHASESEHQGVCTRVCAGTMRQEHSLLQLYYVTSTNITLLKTNLKRRNLSEIFCILSNVCTFCDNSFFCPATKNRNKHVFRLGQMKAHKLVHLKYALLVHLSHTPYVPIWLSLSVPIRLFGGSGEQ